MKEMRFLLHCYLDYRKTKIPTVMGIPIEIEDGMPHWMKVYGKGLIWFGTGTGAVSYTHLTLPTT